MIKNLSDSEMIAKLTFHILENSFIQINMHFLCLEEYFIKYYLVRHMFSLITINLLQINEVENRS